MRKTGILEGLTGLNVNIIEKNSSLNLALHFRTANIAHHFLTKQGQDLILLPDCQFQADQRNLPQSIPHRRCLATHKYDRIQQQQKPP